MNECLCLFARPSERAACVCVTGTDVFWFYHGLVSFSLLLRTLFSSCFLCSRGYKYLLLLSFVWVMSVGGGGFCVMRTGLN